MGKIEPELKKAGTVVYLLSNEGANDLQKMKETENLGEPFVFLSDREAAGAGHYAGHYDGQTMLNPATFVIDRNGKIVYAYVGEDFKTRADTEKVLQAVQKAGQ